ncbi:MAG: hypothetical protein ACREF3_03425, partial [Acetobacteraceae bacterium]
QARPGEDRLTRGLGTGEDQRRCCGLKHRRSHVVCRPGWVGKQVHDAAIVTAMPAQCETRRLTFQQWQLPPLR